MWQVAMTHLLMLHPRPLVLSHVQVGNGFLQSFLCSLSVCLSLFVYYSNGAYAVDGVNKCSVW